MWRNLLILVLVVTLGALLMRISGQLDESARLGDRAGSGDENPVVDETVGQPARHVADRGSGSGKKEEKEPQDAHPPGSTRPSALRPDSPRRGPDGLQLLAAGRVVDDRGEGLPDLLVRVENEKLEANPVIPMSERGVRTDAEGRFEVFGRELESFSLLVETGRDDLPGHRLSDLSPGGEAYLISLPRPASLEGRLLAPDELSPVWVEVTLRDQEGLSSARTSADDEGRFSFTRLQPGRYDIEFGLPGLEKPLLRHLGIELRPGQSAGDDRLRLVDLRQPLPTCSLRVLGRDNLGLAAARVLVHLGLEADGRPRFLDLRTNAEGLVVLPVVDDLLELEISHPDYELCTRKITRQSATVRLVPATTIRLGLEAPSLSLGPMDLLELRLLHDGHRRIGHEKLGRFRFPEETLTVRTIPAEAVIRLRQSGRYELQVWLRDVENDGLRELVGSLWLTLESNQARRDVALSSLEAGFRRALRRLEQLRLENP